MIKLADATTLTSLSRSTLTRAIRAGRLSAQRDAAGTFTIDPAELARAFPDAPGWRAVTYQGEVFTPIDVPPPPDERAVLQAELVGARAVQRQLEERLAEMRGERDSWRGIAERLALPAPAPVATGFMSWFRRK